jgi:uncharacterized protein YjbI with pentapeptide repeats
MSISEQTLGVIIGAGIALIFAALNNFIQLLRDQQKHSMELKKESHNAHLKYDMEKRRRLDEEKKNYITQARKFSKQEEKPIFSGLDLSEALLSGLDLRGADFCAANLTKAQMRYTILAHANLEGALLIDANLEGCDLQSANLRNANLSGVILREANLTNADLTNANLSNADLWQCAL